MTPGYPQAILIGEAMFRTSGLDGECSLLSSFGPLFPKQTHRFFENGHHHQWDKLFPYQAEYLAAVEDVIAPMTPPALLVRLAGVPMSLRLLSPSQGFSEEVFDECSQVLREKYAHWPA